MWFLHLAILSRYWLTFGKLWIMSNFDISCYLHPIPYWKFTGYYQDLITRIMKVQVILFVRIPLTLSSVAAPMWGHGAYIPLPFFYIVFFLFIVLLFFIGGGGGFSAQMLRWRVYIFCLSPSPPPPPFFPRLPIKLYRRDGLVHLTIGRSRVLTPAGSYQRLLKWYLLPSCQMLGIQEWRREVEHA